MLATSDMPFESSLHGRERRAQRDVTKRDLQAALKYGTKERGVGNILMEMLSILQMRRVLAKLLVGH